MDKNRFASLLLDWYEENKRDLPWRKTKDPYKIWLSEIMLQQTRVSQGLPYYKIFLENFPTVKKLASAPEKTVLRLWQGLGYYSRARNLHRCAKIISSQFKGKFPNTYDALLSLPGIGEYTAAAISSMAFDQNHAVVDGNVFRVLARIHGIDLDVGSPAGKKYFFELANSIIPEQTPGLFNQAMMEFGALHCTPKNPNCSECIFRRNCVANQTESQALFPVKSKPAKRKRRYFNYLVIQLQDKFWMRERIEKDVWQGLHEFYLIETSRQSKDSDAHKLFENKVGLNLNGVSNKSIRIKQILSHQEIIAKFFEIKLVKKPLSLKEGKFYTLKEIGEIAKPVLITRYLESRKM
jgi:A/G-specific adenine glycosylase